MPDFSKKIVYLSQAQYQELITNGTITVDGVTVTYDANDIYVTPQAEPVVDVQIYGTSITNNGIANIPIRNWAGDSGLQFINGYFDVNPASNSDIKGNWGSRRVLTPDKQDRSTFYGLAKAAGDTTQSQSSNAVGTYTDAAKGAIQTMLGIDALIAPTEASTTASQAYAANDLFLNSGKLYKATSAISQGAAFTEGTNCSVTDLASEVVRDVQIDGTSITSNGVANVPVANDTGTLGVVRVYGGYANGLGINSDGYLHIRPTTNANVKDGNGTYTPVTSAVQHTATFYGLAKAAGDTTQASSSNAVGTYTSSALAAIHTMLGIDPAAIAAQVDIPLVETVTGSTPSITGAPNTRYNCGEVSTLSITPPASGSIDIYFTSGSTATTLTVPNTVKWPTWFDPTSLDTNTVYELLITDATYGSVMSWAT